MSFDLSLLFPTQPDAFEPVAEYADFAVRHGLHRLWIGQSVQIESHHVLAGVAIRHPGLALGTSVVVTPMRHPWLAAVEARSLARLSGRPYVAGIGAGQALFQRQLLGAPYDKPLRLMTEYATVMRRSLDMGVVDHEGEYVTMKGQMPPLPAPPVEVGIGVLRPAMARTTGRVADAAITWLTPRDYVRDTIVPALEKGAAEAGRRAPRLVMVVQFAVSHKMRDPRRSLLAVFGQHLQAPHYLDMLNRAGLRVSRENLIDSANQVIEHDVYLTGTVEEIAAKICDLREIGASEIILSAGGIHLVEGASAALRDLQDVVAAVRSHG